MNHYNMHDALQVLYTLATAVASVKEDVHGCYAKEPYSDVRGQWKQFDHKLKYYVPSKQVFLNAIRLIDDYNDDIIAVRKRSRADDDIIEYISEADMPLLPGYRMHKESRPVLLPVPMSLVDIDTLFKLLPLCSNDKEYQAIYRFIDAMLITKTGLSFEDWNIDLEHITFKRALYVLTQSLIALYDILASSEFRESDMAGELYNIIDELYSKVDDNIDCGKITDHDLLFMVQVANIDMINSPWAETFEEVKFLHDDIGVFRNLNIYVGMLRQYGTKLISRRYKYHFIEIDETDIGAIDLMIMALRRFIYYRP